MYLKGENTMKIPGVKCSLCNNKKVCPVGQYFQNAGAFDDTGIINMAKMAIALDEIDIFQIMSSMFSSIEIIVIEGEVKLN